jgi:hypothetical protein
MKRRPGQEHRASQGKEKTNRKPTFDKDDPDIYKLVADLSRFVHYSIRSPAAVAAAVTPSVLLAAVSTPVVDTNAPAKTPAMRVLPAKQKTYSSRASGARMDAMTIQTPAARQCTIISPPPTTPPTTPIITYDDRPGLAIRADDTAETAFKNMFESLIEKEFEHRGVPADDAATIMWREHQRRFGPGCNNCFVHLGDLAQAVPNGRTTFGSGNSNNLLSCFVPRFFPLVAQEYPNDPGRNLAIRLVRMWNKHVSATSMASLTEFQMPCTVPNCRCLVHWDFLFNRGDCQQSFATNICGEVEAINDFRTKYYALVKAEFAITEFPDATNFALGRMWRRHLVCHEETCGSACPCWKDLSTLAQGVIAEMLLRREALGWTNRRGFTADSVPTGALLCYSRHSLGRFMQDKLFAAKQEFAVNAYLVEWSARTGEKCGPACQCKMPTTTNNDVVVVHRSGP